MPGEEQLSDEQIAERVQKGETALFAVLVDRYQNRLVRYGRKILFNHSDLEDLVQEVMIKTYRNLQSFDTGRKFSAWIYRIAHNEFINHGKKFSRQLIDYFDLEIFLPNLSAGYNVEKDFDDQKLKTELERSLYRLPEKYREPLVLYFFEGLDYKEIADVLRIPINTVGIRIMRGKNLLKKNFNGHGE